jgi:DnaA family protein
LKQLLLDFTQAPAPTFANFVPGGNTELSHVLEAAAGGRSTERIVYIWGGSGAGKTHLLKAFAAACGDRKARYLSAGEYGPGAYAPVMAMDDVERLSEPQQVALFNAFNEHAFSFLLVAASAPPGEVALRKDLATRLATGLTYRVIALTDEEKRAALAAHAKARGFALTEEVAAYLLTHGRRDMRSLIAALDALDRYSLETGRPITIPLLKSALQLSL